MTTTKLNIANWIECTEVEGPGKRFALWVQGCLLMCPNCCNPHMFSFLPRNIVEVKEVLDWIYFAKDNYGIEGVTFLGGEPMLQAKGLSEIAYKCREVGLSVLVFTGYTLKYLQKIPMPGVSEFLSTIDILVDGPFVSSKPDYIRNWVGSTNQEFHNFTDHYKLGIEFDPKYQTGFELRIYNDGSLQTNGWPSSNIIRGLKNDASTKITPKI